MKNSEYWKERMQALEEEQYQRSAGYYKDLQEQYDRARRDMEKDIAVWYQRLADNNGISYTEAKRLLEKNELKEFQWSVKQYIKAGKENAVDKRWMKELENASAKYHISRLEAMKMQLQHHIEQLSAETQSSMKEFLCSSYEEQYYHTAFEIAKGTEVGSSLMKLDTRRIDTIIGKPWAQDGQAFSDRIWANKNKLVNNLHTELVQNIIRGTPPKQATDNLAKIMNVGRSQAGRLVMTESAAIASRAQQDCFKELGVEKYEIVATLDNKTSEICQEMDGKVFDRKDYQVGLTAPPFHPWCRSTTVPYFDDEFTKDEKRAARDEDTGETYYVSADMTYKEWHNKYVLTSQGNVSYEGIPKTWQKLSDNNNVLNVNPSKLKDNCVNCSIAYEMRKRGYAVIAGNAIKKLQNDPFGGWKAPEIITVEANGDALSSIVADMKKWGDGARAQISVIWNKKRLAGAWSNAPSIGHSFIAEQRNEKTYFIDVQTGEEYNESVFNKVTDNEVYYCRIDTLEPNDLGSTACRKE